MFGKVIMTNMFSAASPDFHYKIADVITNNNKKQVNKTLKELSNLFGGSTSYNAIGTFISSKKKLIKEEVTICESYCTTEDFKKSINDVVDYCENLKDEMKQEAVSLEVNNELYFI